MTLQHSLWGERGGHSSPQQNWAVFSHILINLKSLREFGLFVEESYHLTVENGPHPPALVHVTHIPRGYESLVGISPLFPKARDITVHQFDLDNTLCRLVAPQIGTESPDRTPVILLQILAVELIGEKRPFTKGHLDGNGGVVDLPVGPETDMLDGRISLDPTEQVGVCNSFSLLIHLLLRTLLPPSIGGLRSCGKYRTFAFRGSPVNRSIIV